MKRIIVLAAGLVLPNLFFAQNEVDALRNSQTTFGGTARYNSMSGAFGALGADFSSLSTNPAGIAMYRKSEISFTPSVFGQTTNSSYNGMGSSDSKYNFNFGNAGIVGTFNTNKAEGEPGWVSFNIGFGYNRMANFNNNISIQGPNTGGSSLTDLYVANANNNGNGTLASSLDAFAEGMAFNTYVIDNTANDTTHYFSTVPRNVIQRKTIETSGSMGETVLSFGGNYDNKLYLGATIGFDHISYSENSTYSETASQPDTVFGFKSFKLNQQINTRGTGVNIKLGAIYRITDWMRVGAAFHSPTLYSMHDDYVYTMSSSFVSTRYYGAGDYNVTSPSGSYDYTYVSPQRAIGSLGFIVAKRGLIGIDYEYVDYSSARFNSSDGSFFDVNDQIKKKYTNAGNIRIGGEYRVVEPITLRAGVAFYGNPYKSGVNTDASRTSYSAGIGFREKNYFIDLAYVLTQYKENYYFYDPTNANLNPVLNSFSMSSIMATLGFKF